MSVETVVPSTSRPDGGLRAVVVGSLAPLLVLGLLASPAAADDTPYASGAVTRPGNSGAITRPGSDAAQLEDRLRLMERQLAATQAQIDSLRRELARRDAADAAAPVSDPRTEELERQVEILVEELEEQRLGSGVLGAPKESRYGLAPAASKVYNIERGLSIGGYGELLYQGFDSALDDGSRSGKIDQADFLRAIVYFGYKFNDHIVFNSEIEVEHASTGEDGSVSLEFAYLDFLLRDEINLRAGLVLTPMGFINQIHEPPTFLGARRPLVESIIIPTTWRENGVGAFGSFGPVDYEAYVLNGFDAEGFSAGSGLRGGRQKGSKALADDLAFVARLDWNIVPGVLLGASGYWGQSGHGRMTPGGDEVKGDVELLEAHFEWRWRGLETRLLGARVELDDAAFINELNDLTGAASVGSQMEGWYAQVGYDILAELETDHQVIPFVRWSSLDTQDEVPAGFIDDPANDRDIFTIGVNYKPHPDVVIKVDYQDVDNEAGTGLDQWNFGVGYLF